ncbi:hypothetical protein QYE76_066635 [Lolium multiflorum]|uniref:Transposase (putative) gypsy type domain-containing protein n=1 Tax=Lolium multiflorum TaxID=4521 RepID=A0AAD8WAX4_LOLMU|nr:hypothetical protein QYE76_066635 [Lolium multiflorum]
MATEDLEWERSKISSQDMNLLKRLGFTKKKDALRFPHEESYPSPPIEYRVSFVDHLIRGLSPPIHEFLRGLLFVYGLQLHQLTPNSILHVSIFITLCECFLGVQPNWALWKRIFCLRRNGSHGVAYNIGGVVICVRSDVDYFDVKFPDSVQGWRKKWLYVHEESSDSVEYNIAPFDGKTKIVRRRSWDAEATEKDKLATEALMTRIRELQSTRGKELSGIQITAYFLRIRVQPLQARKNPLWTYAGDEDVERLSTDLPAKDLEKLIRRISKLNKKDTVPSSCKVNPFCSANPLPEGHLVLSSLPPLPEGGEVEERAVVTDDNQGASRPESGVGGSQKSAASLEKENETEVTSSTRSSLPAASPKGKRKRDETIDSGASKADTSRAEKTAPNAGEKALDLYDAALISSDDEEEDAPIDETARTNTSRTLVVSEARPDGDETSPPQQNPEHPTPDGHLVLSSLPPLPEGGEVEERAVVTDDNQGASRPESGVGGSQKSAASLEKKNETEVTSSTRSSLPAASPKGKRKRDETIDSGTSKADTSRAEKTAPNAGEKALDLYDAALISSDDEEEDAPIDETARTSTSRTLVVSEARPDGDETSPPQQNPEHPTPDGHLVLSSLHPLPEGGEVEERSVVTDDNQGASRPESGVRGSQKSAASLEKKNETEVTSSTRSSLPAASPKGKRKRDETIDSGASKADTSRAEKTAPNAGEKALDLYDAALISSDDEEEDAPIDETARTSTSRTLVVSEARPDGDETSPPQQNPEHPTPDPFMKELIRFGTQFIGYRDYAGKLEEKLAEANKRADALATELEQSETARMKAEAKADTIEDLQKRLDDAKRALEENVAQHSAREEEILGRLESQSRRFVRRTHQEYELQNPEDDELLDALSLLEIHSTEARNGLAEAEAGLSRLFPYFFKKKEEPAVFIDLAKCFTSNEDLGLQLRQEGLKVGVEGTMALIADSQQHVDWSRVGNTGEIEMKKWQSLIKAAKPSSKKILATLGYKLAPAPSSSKPDVK